MKKILKTDDRNPMSINIIKLQRYNFNDWTLEEIVFFEYIVIKAQAFGFQPFYHSSATIAKETGIKRTKLDSIIKRFIKEGFLNIQVKGMPKVKWFEVDMEMIFAKLPKIYQYVEYGQPSAYMNKLLADFYKPLVAKYQQKNINKNIKEETKKETTVYAQTVTSLVNEIYTYLEVLQEQEVLQEEQCKFHPDQLVSSLEQYDHETILESLKEYFEQSEFEGSMNVFIHSAISESGDGWIEQFVNKRSSQAKALIDRLNFIFAERRKLATEDGGKRYGRTKLAVKKTLIGKVIIALKNLEEFEVKNAFIAYADSIIKGEEEPRNILDLFFAVKEGDYVVINKYLEVYNCDYSYVD